MKDWGVHTDLGEVVGVDGKVEEEFGEDKLDDNSPATIVL